MEIRKIVEKVKELKEIEQRANEARRELEKKLFESVERPKDGKPLWLDEETKIVWRNEAKIPQKVGKVWLERNPELSKRVFSLTVNPKTLLTSTSLLYVFFIAINVPTPFNCIQFFDVVKCNDVATSE